jgi:hypothetical protein
MDTAKDIPLSEFEGYPDIQDIVANLPLNHFNFVHEFCFKKQEDLLGDIWSDVNLILEACEPPRMRIGFKFHRVSVQSFNGFGQIMGLYIQSIAEQGWEKLRFEVGDYEDGRIHLYCHSVVLYRPEQEVPTNH